MRWHAPPPRPSPAELRDARVAAGLTREGLAYLSGLSISTIGRIERGDAQPNRSTLRVIAQTLDDDPEAA